MKEETENIRDKKRKSLITLSFYFCQENAMIRFAVSLHAFVSNTILEFSLIRTHIISVFLDKSNRCLTELHRSFLQKQK